jgi:hypothetical protein
VGTNRPGVPCLDGFVVAAREEERAVGAKSKCGNVARVALEDTCWSGRERTGVEEAHSPVAGDRYVAAAWWDRQRIDLLRWCALVSGVVVLEVEEEGEKKVAPPAMPTAPTRAGTSAARHRC